MKSPKTPLFFLAGVWTALLIIEKVASAASLVQVKDKIMPVKILFDGARVVRSLLLFSLVVVNVFMAITLLDKESELTIAFYKLSVRFNDSLIYRGALKFVLEKTNCRFCKFRGYFNSLTLRRVA